MKRLSLVDSKDIWINELLIGADKKECISQIQVLKKLDELGYLVDRSIEKLMGIYEMNNLY